MSVEVGSHLLRLKPGFTKKRSRLGVARESYASELARHPAGQRAPPNYLSAYPCGRIETVPLPSVRDRSAST